MPDSADNRTTIRDFLISRRAKISPERAGLPAGLSGVVITWRGKVVGG